VLGSYLHGCPCGYVADPQRPCQYSASQMQRYTARISGPRLDRIDIHTEVPPVPYAAMEARAAAEASVAIRYIEALSRRYPDWRPRPPLARATTVRSMPMLRCLQKTSRILSSLK
jgi:predicted ATPase with chaperone activity